MKRTALVLIVIFLGALSCAVNPVTGKRELSLISEGEEVALGKQSDLEVRGQYGVYDDASVNRYVQSVGTTLAPYTQRPQLSYQFAVLDTPVVNAFALPGGYIYVTRGLLALMSSEAELAVVLGHEMGHVNARHSVRRMSEMMLVQAGLAVGSALSEIFGKVSGVAGVGVQLLFLKYSRDDERQADALGVEYARRGAYNPAEMVAFFGSLQKLGDLSGGRALPGFLSTHPLTGERIQNVKLMLQDSDRSLAVKETIYLRKIEGLVYGDDPRQGFVEGQIFYHPELTFFLAIPAGWKVENTPTQLILLSKDEKAAILLQAEKTQEDLRVFARQKAATIQGARLVNEDRFNVPGLLSYHERYEISQQDGNTASLRLSLIKKGAFVYTFLALAAHADFANFDPDFRRTAQSFQELQDPAYLKRRPLRVAVAEADGRRTLQDIFASAGMKDQLWPAFAVMNELELSAVPPSGRLVKCAR
jgi:predicted Zn-dependent protease